tara:strand:+ start:216 stop:320 length:105 start_codon:yes stop_codon:yes gene_type:complete
VAVAAVAADILQRVLAVAQVVLVVAVLVERITEV